MVDVDKTEVFMVDVTQTGVFFLVNGWRLFNRKNVFLNSEKKIILSEFKYTSFLLYKRQLLTVNVNHTEVFMVNVNQTEVF